MTEIHAIQNVGKLIVRERRELRTELCRTCGSNLASEVLNATMLTGWWGIISFFANLRAIVVTYGSLQRARSLPPPTATSGVVGPLPPGLPAARPLYERGGVYVALTVLVAVVLVAIAQLDTGSAASTGTRSTTSDSQRDSSPLDLRGLCLIYGADGAVTDIVACTQRHDARVLDVTTDPFSCPFEADYYFELPDRGRTYYVCVDR